MPLPAHWRETPGLPSGQLRLIRLDGLRLEGGFPSVDTIPEWKVYGGWDNQVLLTVATFIPMAAVESTDREFPLPAWWTRALQT